MAYSIFRHIIFDDHKVTADFLTRPNCANGHLSVANCWIFSLVAFYSQDIAYRMKSR